MADTSIGIRESLVVPQASSPEAKVRPPVSSEQYRIFDWTNERKGEVIAKSTEYLRDCITRGDTAPAPEDAESMLQLWSDVTKCFQSGGDLKIKDTLIASYNPNTLPAHSDYHVAKVMTVGALLVAAGERGGARFNLEDRLALIGAIAIHDVGSLQRKNEQSGVTLDSAQPAVYETHELTSLRLVDQMIDALQLQSPGIDPLRLKAKIKILIAATAVPLDTNFSSPTLDKLPIVELLSDHLSEDILPKSEGYIDQLKKEVLAAKMQLNDLKTCIRLVQMMTAADHGAYLLEPCRMGEVISLWQEYNELFENDAHELIHRKLPPDTDSYKTFLVSTFPDMQKQIYGDMLRTLSENPFWSGKGIDATFAEVASFQERLLQPVAEDPLVRFEGFFSPIQLAQLREDVHLSTDQNLQSLILTFSQQFARKFHEAGDFNALATNVLQEIYTRCETPERKKEFFKKAFEVMLAQTKGELSENGTLTVHIAPYAYEREEGIGTFFSSLTGALDQLSPEDRRKIGGIVLTYRENMPDDHYQILLMRAAALKGEREETWGVSMGGIPEEGTRVGEFLDAARGENVVTVIHFGLDTDSAQMNHRLDQVLAREDVEDITVHIDDRFDWFVAYYEQLSVEDLRRGRMQQILKSANPLGYLLTRGKEAYEAVQKFFTYFPDVPMASHNSCLLGDLGLSAQTHARSAFISSP